MLGTPANLTPAAIAKSRHIRQANARTNQQNQQATRLGGLLHAQGLTPQQIAQALNPGGYRTRRGKLFLPKRGSFVRTARTCSARWAASVWR